MKKPMSSVEIGDRVRFGRGYEFTVCDIDADDGLTVLLSSHEESKDATYPHEFEVEVIQPTSKES